MSKNIENGSEEPGTIRKIATKLGIAALAGAAVGSRVPSDPVYDRTVAETAAQTIADSDDAKNLSPVDMNLERARLEAQEARRRDHAQRAATMQKTLGGICGGALAGAATGFAMTAATILRREKKKPLPRVIADPDPEKAPDFYKLDAESQAKVKARAYEYSTQRGESEAERTELFTSTCQDLAVNPMLREILRLNETPASTPSRG